MITVRNVFNVVFWVYFLALLTGNFIPLGSAQQSMSSNEIFNLRWDYLLHALLYIPLPVLMLGVIKRPGIIALLSLLLASGLEIAQMFVEFRTFNMNDFFSNLLGVAIGFGIAAWVRKFVV
ncbi:MAG: VanZ family protein [Bacteroidales bacterium]